MSIPFEASGIANSLAKAAHELWHDDPQQIRRRFWPRSLADGITEVAGALLRLVTHSRHDADRH
jgi:hypothetical protein